MIAEQAVTERSSLLPATVDLSVVIPAYNEADRIDETICETVQELYRIGIRFEIVVVDDGSRDATHQRATAAAERFHDVEYGTVRVVTYKRNGGKGRAVKFGAAQTTGDSVAFLDADLELHPRLLARMMEIKQAGDADIVIGSKRHPLSVLNYPPDRKIYSTIYFYLVKLLFGLPVRDTQTGIKIVPGDFAREILPGLRINRYAYDLEMLVTAHAMGLRIVEAPIELNYNRRFRRIGISAIRGIGLDTFRIWRRVRTSGGRTR